MLAASAEEKESWPQASSKLCKRARSRTLLAEVGQHHINQCLAGEHLAFQSQTPGDDFSDDGSPAFVPSLATQASNSLEGSK